MLRLAGRYVELIDVVLYSRLVCLSINTHVHERWGLVLMDFLVWVLIGLGLGRDYANKNTATDKLTDSEHNHTSKFLKKWTKYVKFIAQQI